MVLQKTNNVLSIDVKSCEEYLETTRKPHGFYTKIAMKASKELDDYISVPITRYFINNHKKVNKPREKSILVYRLALEAAKEQLILKAEREESFQMAKA